MAQLPEKHPVTSADEPSGMILEPSPDLLPPAPFPPPVPSPVASPVASPAEKHVRVTVPRTRLSAAWFGIWAGAVALILLIIFVAQNTANVRIDFLWMSGNVSLAVALLIAGVGGAIIAMAVAALRIIQLRRLVRRGR
jgi:uncharacterized integral membrane protein